MHPGFVRDVQLVIGNIVAHHVAAVVGEPEFVRDRVPREADAVADALGVGLKSSAVGLHPPDRCRHRSRRADVARRTDRHVEHVVGYKSDEFPRVSMVRVREIVADHDRLGRRVELLSISSKRRT
jgi:hypothetical protein